jgi:hypothetical protein
MYHPIGITTGEWSAVGCVVETCVEQICGTMPNGTQDFALANARLIAQAPRMYTLLLDLYLSDSIREDLMNDVMLVLLEAGGKLEERMVLMSDEPDFGLCDDEEEDEDEGNEK